MPLVGNKHFAYTPKGMKKAVAHAKKTGNKVKIDKKGIGGMIKKYSQGGPLKGPSHKKGGIPAVVKGGQPIEMEGGEYVIKKSSAKKLGPDILNYINKNGAVPKMSNGGSTNPYLKDYRESEAKMASELAELAQPGTEEYEQLKKARYQKTGKFGKTGRDSWLQHQVSSNLARAHRDRATKRAKGKAEARGALSEFGTQSSLAAKGGLRARADQRAAYKIIQQEEAARKAAAEKEQEEVQKEVQAQKAEEWSEKPENKGGIEGAKRSFLNPYKEDALITPSMFNMASKFGIFKNGGQVNNLFSLLKMSNGGQAPDPNQPPPNIMQQQMNLFKQMQQQNQMAAQQGMMAREQSRIDTFGEGYQNNPYMQDVIAAQQEMQSDKYAPMTPGEETAFELQAIRKGRDAGSALWQEKMKRGGMKTAIGSRAKQAAKRAAEEAQASQQGSGNISMLGRLKRLGHARQARRAAGKL